MKQKFRKGLLGVMTALLAICLTGCKTASAESVPASSEKIHLRYGITGWKTTKHY
ncbi:hypothetical protein [Lacrimispora sp.]|uniref:hypothetical protein n=1 Tax=Lacrimispora sp. TaxID=2719234 RepID=UPI0032E48BC3